MKMQKFFFNSLSRTEYRGLILFLILAAVFSIKEGLGGGDFDVYLDASRRLISGENIYAAPYYTETFICFQPFYN